MEQHNQTPPLASPPARTNGLAVAALVLGILAPCLFLPALPALIMGIVALSQINANPQRSSGKGMAIAGIALSAVSILTFPFVAAIMFPVFAKARAVAKGTTCMANVKSIETAMMVYSVDHGTLPPAGKWNDSLKPYQQVQASILHCPEVPDQQPSYGMNSRLSKATVSSVKQPEGTVMIFEAAPGANRNGGPTLLPTPQRHPQGNNIGFADGHVKPIPNTDNGTLNWELAPK